MAKVLFFGVVLLAAFVTATSGLRCFVCNSHLDRSCSDPFFENSGALRSAYLLNCNESPEGIQPFCRKTKTYIARTGDVRIHRDCGYIERGGSSCYHQRAEEFITDTCECKSDMCNSATAFGATALLALIFPLCLAALL